MHNHPNSSRKAKHVKCFIHLIRRCQNENLLYIRFVVVQFLSYVQLFVIPWTAACQAAVLHYLQEFAQIELVMPSNHLILCHPLLLFPSIFPSIRVFSSELALHIRYPNYWSFSFSNSPSNEYSGLIYLKIYWFDLLAVQRTLKSLLQHYNLKISLIWHSAFFTVKLSHPYMTTGKTIAMTIQTLLAK